MATAVCVPGRKKFTETQRQNILTGKWLDDILINMGQDMLCQQHPQILGLQSVLLGQNFGFSPQTSEFFCGLFALANSSALCNGIDPCTIVYTQSAMREHLCNCFHHGALTPFPNKKKRQKLGPPEIETFDIYCFCRQPDYGETMVECTACKQLFHKSCVHVPRACIHKKKKSWCCPNCKI